MHPDSAVPTNPGAVPGPQVAQTDGGLLAGGVPCAVLDMASTRILDANPAFADLVRLDMTEVMGFDFLTLVPPQNRALIKGVLSGMAAGTIRFFEGPVRWQLPCGEPLDVERSWRLVEDDGPAPSKILVAALPAGGPAVPAQPASIPDRPHLAVGTVDHAWRLTELGLDAATWLGLDAEAYRGVALHDIVHPDDVSRLLIAAGRSGMGRRGVAMGIRVRRHDGEWTPVRCEVSPLCGHTPPRFTVVMWVPEGTPAEEPAVERAARLEDHLWRIAIEVAAAGIGNAPATTGVWWSDPALRGVGPRQLEILRRLLRGERVPRIAKDLYLSQSTVRNHLSAIYRRLHVHSQAELLARLLPGHEN